MANYTNEMFDFAYSSERSIEDGIQELSDAEMGTVIISYVVMFVYITIALGKFKGIRNVLVSGNIWTQSGGRTGMAIIKNLTFLISFRPPTSDGEQDYLGRGWHYRRIGCGGL